MSSANQRIRPLVAASSPLTRLKSVVFPAPLGPSSARRSPARIVSVTPSTARRPPNARETFSRTRQSATSLMRPPRHVLPGVQGLFEEFCRVVLPELRHVRERLDHGVLQLAVHALDP